MNKESQGERLRHARDGRGLKQGYVARAAGITQAHLSRIENDESGVTEYTLKKLATAIGVPFEDLIVRQSDEPQQPTVNLDDVLSSDTTMIRFLGGDRPDDETFDWIKRSLQVIRGELRRRREI